MKNKVKIYIDGANVFYAQKKLKWFIDWLKVKNELSKQWDILEMRYYTGVKENDSKMADFLRYLDNIGINSITKPVKIIKIDDNHSLSKLHGYNEIYKSNCDVEIVVDILLERKNIDEIILFSGDSDFKYLIRKLKDLGKKVTIVSSRKTISWEVKLEASEHIYLEEMKDKIIRE